MRRYNVIDFFFSSRRRHTRYWRDWSSDVCSSDLRTSEIVDLGYPVLVATSKKSVIGLALDKPVTDRTIGTLATTAIGVYQGASFVRVHDISENSDIVRMTKAVMNER